MGKLDPRLLAKVARLPGVRAAVAAEGRKIQGRANARFAAHDRPGGHSVGGEQQATDYVVYLKGPVPHIIEWGSYQQRGLHILGGSI